MPETDLDTTTNNKVQGSQPNSEIEGGSRECLDDLNFLCTLLDTHLEKQKSSIYSVQTREQVPKGFNKLKRKAYYWLHVKRQEVSIGDSTRELIVISKSEDKKGKYQIMQVALDSITGMPLRIKDTVENVDAVIPPKGGGLKGASLLAIAESRRKDAVAQLLRCIQRDASR